MGSEAAESIVPQTQNPQKEPSMEEILASIRRIIEDSDQAGPADAKADASAASLVEPVTTDDDAPDEAAPIGQDEARTVEPARAIGQPEGDEAAASELEAGPSTGDEQGMKAWSTAPEIAAEDDAATAQDVADWSVAMETEIDPGPPPSPPREDNAPQHLSAVASGRAASILSEQTSRQVAAAFGELSDAFAENRRQRFDEMAAEMMRPMLQEWLDNNLPTLVERLVREEIERVARGG
ncbi:DUF2497 domain-containing protein [Nitratireductor sp. StC3]|nr:DUF2497 domain-containing protein [Nitratireductor sp. StC3]